MGQENFAGSLILRIGDFLETLLFFLGVNFCFFNEIGFNLNYHIFIFIDYASRQTTKETTGRDVKLEISVLHSNNIFS